MSEHPVGLGSLLKTRRFLPLFLTQFLGALNDNVYKNALIALLTFRVISLDPDTAKTLIIWGTALFIAPYFFFSAIAGTLADRMDKARMMRITKLWEIGVMCIGAIGFFTTNISLLMVMLFMMGTQSAFFSPCKYAVLPTHLKTNELVAGNGLIEAATFIAILGGTIIGTQMVLMSGGPALVAMLVLVVAVTGYFASRSIPPAPPKDASAVIDWNIARASWALVTRARADRIIFLCILGDAWFWFVGTSILSLFPLYVRHVLYVDKNVYTLFLTLFSLGVGLGALTCNRLLKGEVSARYVPLAALGMAIFAVDLFFAARAIGTPDNLAGFSDLLSSWTGWRLIIDMAGLALFAGLYEVPLFAIIQHRSNDAERSRIIAANNIINAFGIMASAGISQALLVMGVSIPQIFLILGIMCVPASIIISRATPDSLFKR